MFSVHNQKIDVLLPKLEAFQREYIKNSPVFFQGLQTHSEVPALEKVGDRLNRKPADKALTWLDINIGEIAKELPFSVEIHEYVAPPNRSNKGWQVMFRTIIDGKEYIKSVGYGVELDSRTWDWRELKII
jgi:hypothetical protein